MPGPSRQESWWVQDRTLRTLLEKFRECEASDEQDMIYALIGISSDAHDSNILDQNYEKLSEQVVQDTILFIIPESYKCHSHWFKFYINLGVSTLMSHINDLNSFFSYGCDSGWTALAGRVITLNR